MGEHGGQREHLWRCPGRRLCLCSWSRRWSCGGWEWRCCGSSCSGIAGHRSFDDPPVAAAVGYWRPTTAGCECSGRCARCARCGCLDSQAETCLALASAAERRQCSTQISAALILVWRHRPRWYCLTRFWASDAAAYIGVATLRLRLLTMRDPDTSFLVVSTASSSSASAAHLRRIFPVYCLGPTLGFA